MKEKKNILVFPCGSEIGLEVYRSLKYSTYFNLIGASSVDDHGRFVYENYIGDVPYVTDGAFVPYMKNLIATHHIDAIYPALDTVMTPLKHLESQLGCKVIAPSVETVDVCSSKRQTYAVLKDAIRVPKIYASTSEITQYPVFGKHDVGYGSIGAKRLDDVKMVEEYLSKNPDALICEYLPGEEYTVDCFSDREGKLLFSGVRKRARIKNGISVRTMPVEDKEGEFSSLIKIINNKIAFHGAWFAQFKRNVKGELTLLEIAARFGGSSSLYRAQGINFAQLSLFEAFGYDVSVIRNQYNVEMDRALDNVYKIDMHYSEVYVDFDDCLCLDKRYVNTDLVAFLYQCVNECVKLTLLTHHDNDIHESLKAIRLDGLFDRIIHIDRSHPKSDYIDNKDCVFIDDSFAERRAIAEKGIPVFSVDMIPMLLK